MKPVQINRPVNLLSETEYYNENQVLDVLSISKSTLKNLVRKGLLSQYAVGVKYFYLKGEITGLIEANEKRARNEKAWKEYNDIPVHHSGEKRFVHSLAIEVTYMMESLELGEYTQGRNWEILRSLLKTKGNFEYVAEEYGLTRERVRQIANKTMRRLPRYIKYWINLGKRADELNKENERLSNLTLELQSIIDKNTSLSRIPEKILSTLATPIEDIDFTVRAYNSLKALKVRSLGDIIKYSARELLRMRNLGRHTLGEIEDTLNEHGLHLGMDLSTLQTSPVSQQEQPLS